MLHDSTIDRGSFEPVAKLNNGKKINLIKTNKNTNAKIQPFKLSSFHNKYQNFFNPFFKFIEITSQDGF